MSNTIANPIHIDFNRRIVNPEYFHWPAVGLLLAAASLKSIQLSTSPYVENLVFQSRTITVALIVFEITLAFWLIANIWQTVARLVAISSFSIFFIEATRRFYLGADSCGCFGIIEIPPVFTVVMDAFLVGLLVRWIPRRVSCAPRLRILIVLMASLFIAILPVTMLSTSQLSDIGEIVGDGELIIIEPQGWAGKQLPITKFISENETLMSGTWDVVLYHEDCPKCKKLIEAGLTGQLTKKTLFVEVPPYKSPSRHDQPGLVWRKLSEQFKWFVEAPMTVSVDDGVVVQ